MDRLRAMEVYVRVVELGSFTRAAQALRIPRATATAAVQELEARLSVRLLHRTTRRLAPTADGVAYHEAALRILTDVADTEAAVSGAIAVTRGRIRVDLPAAAGRHVVARELPAFLEAYPEVVVELGTTDRPVDLVAEGVDCAVRGGELHDEALVAKRLGELPVITCAAPSWLEANGVPRHPDDLERFHFVNFISPRTGRAFEVDFERDDVLVSKTFPHRVAANDTDTWITLGVAGLGLLQTPCGRSVREHLERGSLVRVLHDWRSPPLPLWIVWPRSRHLAARVRAFVEWSTTVFARECLAAHRAVEL